jgi:hypothetical protein
LKIGPNGRCAPSCNAIVHFKDQCYGNMSTFFFLNASLKSWYSIWNSMSTSFVEVDNGIVYITNAKIFFVSLIKALDS